MSPKFTEYVLTLNNLVVSLVIGLVAMPTYECSCKCSLVVEAEEEDRASELASLCLEGEEEVCEDIECSCECEEV